jgi:hypothetical protein
MGYMSYTFFSLINMSYHLELRVHITLYRHSHFLPTKLYHILQCALSLSLIFSSIFVCSRRPFWALRDVFMLLILILNL